MVLSQHDAELIDLWATHGMPENQSTRDKAVRLLVALRAENRELVDALERLTGICADCLAGRHDDCVAASTDVCECFDADHDEEAV